MVSHAVQVVGVFLLVGQFCPLVSEVITDCVQFMIHSSRELANYGLLWDETAHVKHLISIWERNRLIAVEKL